MTEVDVRDGDELKTDDTAPNLRADLVKNNGVAEDLSDFTVEFRMREAGDEELVVDDDTDGNVSIEDEDKGRVEYSWQESDTSTAGTYECEFQIDDGNGTIKSFPNTGFFTVKIEEGLD